MFSDSILAARFRSLAERVGSFATLRKKLSDGAKPPPTDTTPATGPVADGTVAAVPAGCPAKFGAPVLVGADVPSGSDVPPGGDVNAPVLTYCPF
jgi:hypothetical protein